MTSVPDEHKIDVYAAEGHFEDHLQPVWNELPEGRRGIFATGLDELQDRGDRRHLCLVASGGNRRHATSVGYPRVVLMQHGAGQSYLGGGGAPHLSYAGFPHHRGLVGILHPGPDPVEKDGRAYPDLADKGRIQAIGMPKLAPWRAGDKGRAPDWRREDRPFRVAVSFHWDCRVCPETRTALGHYERAFADWKDALEEEGIELVGHSHPRIRSRAKFAFEGAGVPFLGDFEQVLQWCDAYAVDNSSTLFEFAASVPKAADRTARPVIVLNSPHYRRGVEHGLRFWQASGIGPNVNRPEDFVAAVKGLRRDFGTWCTKAGEVLTGVYAYRDGKAAERAVGYVQEWAEETASGHSERRHWLRAHKTFANAGYLAHRDGATVESGERFYVWGKDAAKRLAEEGHAERIDLQALTVDTLRGEARRLGIEGRSSMRKTELIDALQQSAPTGEVSHA